MTLQTVSSLHSQSTAPVRTALEFLVEVAKDILHTCVCTYTTYSSKLHVTTNFNSNWQR